MDNGHCNAFRERLTMDRLEAGPPGEAKTVQKERWDTLSTLDALLNDVRNAIKRPAVA